MSCGSVLLLCIGIGVAFALIKAISQGASPSQGRSSDLPLKDWSNPNETEAGIDPQHLVHKHQKSMREQMICPHCQVRGSVSTWKESRKAGVSGSKAAAAVITGGVSVLATGLSRKEEITKAKCGNCGAEWSF
jgi:transcription elongation factor Elf1